MKHSQRLETAIVLKSVAIFANLSQPVLYQIADVVEPVDVAADTTIFQQGDRGDCLYIIVSGRVRVHQGERVLNSLSTGHVFGEMALLDSEPRLASVTAETDTRLFRLDQEPFYALMAEHSEVSRGIIRLLSRHLRERVRDLAQAREELERLASTASPADADSLAQIGGYDVAEQIGAGGMSQVYKGYQAALDRAVAIKILAPALVANPEFRSRFEREAKLIANLTHPNIVTIYDYGHRRDTYFIAMEYIDGITLGAHLQQQHPLPLAEVVAIAREIANALDYAHERNLVHRDIKLDNVMLEHLQHGGKSDQQQRVILMDFGLSKDLSDNVNGETSEVLGTVQYMAPEQIFSPHSVDKRADIYSFGVLVYRLLTGRYPFDSSNMFEILWAHHRDAPAPPSQLRPEVPAEMSRAVLRALSKDPQDRYDSAGQFAVALTLALENL